MTRVLILFYLSQGHIEKLAEAVAEGARATGAKFDVKRVPETVPGRGRQKRALQARSSAPLATVTELEHYDAIIVGTGTLWFHVLADGPSSIGPAPSGCAERSTARSSGPSHQPPPSMGQEMTLFSIISNLPHFGMIIVGLPYSQGGQMSVGEIVGGAPYGATTVAGGDGLREPTETDLAGERHQGELVAWAAAKLLG
jgi:NAD(P)H dehydrogenase (quinone)